MRHSSHPTYLFLNIISVVQRLTLLFALEVGIVCYALLFREGNFQLQAQKNFLMLSSSLIGDPSLENVTSPSLEISHQRLKVLGWGGGDTRQLFDN